MRKILTSEGFRQFADHLPLVIALSNADLSQFLFVNRAYEEIWGRTVESLYARSTSFLNGVHPDDQDRLKEAVEGLIKGETIENLECRVVRPNGSTCWVLCRGFPVRDAQDRIIRLVGSAEDITKRKLAEDELRQNEARFRAILANSPNLIFLKDLEGRYILVSREYQSTLQINTEQFKGKKSAEIFAPEQAAHFESSDLQAIRTRSRVEFETILNYSDGPHTNIVHKFPLFDSAGEIFAIGGIATDITQQRRMEEALRKSEAQYRSLVEGSPYGIFRSTAEGRFLVANPALVRMLGYESEAELLRANLAKDVYVDPAERQRIIEQHSKTELILDRDLVWKRKDGRRINVKANGRVIRDETGGVECFEVIVEDVTERKKLEEQTRQAQKMEAIGQFAEGIAHDFNNLLQVILGQSQLVSKQIDPHSGGGVRLQHVVEAAERAQWLTAQLMIFARRGELELQAIDLNGALKELRELLERLIGEDIVLVTELSPTLGRVRSDCGLIQQVIMNLAANARDAMPGGGTLTIATENVEISETSAAEHCGVPAGRYVMLRVADSGTGMDAATQARLFEPFFTTKEPSKGTGLGLAVVRSIVAQSGGHVTVQSELSRGSTFTVFLPVVEEVEQTRPAKKTEELSPRGSETVLLVEDAQGVRMVVREYLQSGGYSVLAPETPGQVLELAQKHQGPIHLLLTDVVMPGMGGAELARQTRALRRDIKVLYMSGYAPRAAGRDEGLEEGAPFLQKPFTSEDLLRSVRRVLDTARAS